MSTYSEHAAEAERLIGLSSIQPDTDSSQAVTNAAQVHAMLALAEQQRITNLIAAINGDTSYYSAVGSAAQEVLGANTLNPDIADALGIKTGDNE